MRTKASRLPQEPQIGSSAQDIIRDRARDDPCRMDMGVVQSVHVRDVAVKTFDAAPLELLQHLRIEIDHQDLSENAVVLDLFCVRLQSREEWSWPRGSNRETQLNSPLPPLR